MIENNSEEKNKKRVTNEESQEEDELIDRTLRPHTLREYVGQKKTKEHLQIFMEAARMRSEPIEHVLIYGPPGIGKTTLAHVLAHEMGVAIKVTSGPAIERAGDLASLLTNLKDHDILFIDEIHRLPRTVEEVLYPAMEDFCFDIILGKGPGAKSVRLDLPRFTLIGATTRIGLISSPLRDRFGVTLKLDYYTEEEIAQIITRSAKILDTEIVEDAVVELAHRSRRTPRIANRLLRRVRDYAEVKGDGTVNAALTGQALELMEVDKLGLDRNDRMLLETIVNKFSGGPVGINSLAAATGEDEDTITDIYEPFLMQIGFLERTPKGRKITKQAYKHLGITIADSTDSTLL